MANFTVQHQDTSCPARTGTLQTAHGVVETPVFMPVGTSGAVKGITPQQLNQAHAQIILANTYHLMLRPGIEAVEKIGGLHKLMAWDKPILTDSGGYQVFSLSSLTKIDDNGVEFVTLDGFVGTCRHLSRIRVTRMRCHQGQHITVRGRLGRGGEQRRNLARQFAGRSGIELTRPGAAPNFLRLYFRIHGVGPNMADALAGDNLIAVGSPDYCGASSVIPSQAWRSSTKAPAHF